MPAKPLSFKTEITGTADDADHAAFEKEYGRHVRALRKIGFTVNGQAATSTLATRDEATDELIPAGGAILHAADVD